MMGGGKARALDLCLQCSGYHDLDPYRSDFCLNQTKAGRARQVLSETTAILEVSSLPESALKKRDEDAKTKRPCSHLWPISREMEPPLPGDVHLQNQACVRRLKRISRLLFWKSNGSHNQQL